MCSSKLHVYVLLLTPHPPLSLSLQLCVVVRDSQFIQGHVSDIQVTSLTHHTQTPPLSVCVCLSLSPSQLNNAVSGALDRLHYEKDPCVRYDSTRKVWIYLHRGRSEADFGEQSTVCVCVCAVYCDTCPAAVVVQSVSSGRVIWQPNRGRPLQPDPESDL